MGSLQFLPVSYSIPLLLGGSAMNQTTGECALVPFI
jgi:hypothetical protein